MLSLNFCPGAWSEFKFNYGEQIEETEVRSSKEKGEMGDNDLALKEVGDLRREHRLLSRYQGSWVLS